MQRNQAGETLKNEKNTVLILPLKAGGTGLNYGFDDDMLILGLHWNQAVIKQVIARINRAGRDGDRRIDIVTRNNAHDDYVSCLTREKMKSWKFLSKKNLNIKDHLKLYLESLLQGALKQILIRCKNKPGIYTDKENIEHPILDIQVKKTRKYRTPQPQRSSEKGARKH